MNILGAVGVLFIALIVGSKKQVERAATELEEQRKKSEALDAWTFHNNIH